ncbi:hypothetical protein [Aminobacter sp. MET-1]|uniref:hypothetical protein n=1 Tax=Aminobacter sp. MET-1 TaxID=2951085 RepID=UPI00226AB3EE|nr:hypothetical protein [Aminobacter sp. MET-1]MCX8572880.1 hypothetical protein [Aminobacter sp. MET-1]
MQLQIGTLGHEDGTSGHGYRRRRRSAGLLRSRFNGSSGRMNAIEPGITENLGLQRLALIEACFA